MPTVRTIVVAGTRSGCGKTSTALGLMAALARRGLDIRPFKAGPDFIDPGHHARARALNPALPWAESHNLDTWMMPPCAVAELFARHAEGGDIAVVEGVMGLFDGFSATDEAGSTAALAKLIGAPVLLVADVASMARSAAALVGGYARFDPDLRLAGVVLNNAGSPSHAELVRQSLSAALPDVPVLGAPLRDTSIALPSRHLGLVTAPDGESGDQDAEVYARLADWAEAHLDLDAVLGAAAPVPLAAFATLPPPPVRARIAVARDAAFCFCYAENLRLLRQAGAELAFFSPLADKRLPEGCGGLYLPGGYPELHLYELSQNARLRKEIKAFSAAGRPVYAECGGFMYLLDSVRGPRGRRFQMCGVFEAEAAMGERFAALGYREAAFTADTPLGPAGTTARGHEFHYSSLAHPPAGAAPTYALSGRKGALDRPEGFLVRNTLGSYVHLHFGSNPALAGHFVNAAS